jgi:putative membrane protein
MTETTFKRIIYVLSALIPLVVILLFQINLEGYDTRILPPIYASTNAITAVLLLVALFAIKQKNIVLHKNIIKVCLGLSVLFLLLYVVRHITSSEVKFGDLNHDNILDDTEKATVGSLRYFYYALLISHIGLSVVVIPFVLFAYMRGILNQVEKHKKIVRFAFPIWLYVSATGAIVYWMIAPYY